MASEADPLTVSAAVFALAALVAGFYTAVRDFKRSRRLSANSAVPMFCGIGLLLLSVADQTAAGLLALAFSGVLAGTLIVRNKLPNS